jgi:hypothetical protein
MTDFTNKAAFRRQKVKKLETEEGTFYLRVVSGAERDAWLQIVKAEQAKPEISSFRDIYCPLLVRAICDEKGSRIFKDDETAELVETDSRLLNDLFDAALAHNRLGKEAVDEAKNG